MDWHVGNNPTQSAVASDLPGQNALSERRVERALARLAAPGAVLAPGRTGAWCVYPGGDRRRRPLVKLDERDVRALEASGAVAIREGDYVLTPAGRARVARAEAPPEEAFATQHRQIIDRAIVADDGSTHRVRGHDPDAALRRLAALRDANGAPWLSGAELAAAVRLRKDWELGQRGLVRGSDWTSPPNASSARAPANRAEHAASAFCDARRRASESLEGLAPPLRRVVERLCLCEEGLESVERTESWPARSAKLALKLALAQLAEAS